MVCDTGLLLNQALDRGETVLLEAGQATLLDVDHGTYPFVTSSSATSGGACTGSGIPPMRLDQVIGIVKAYTTRVGEGPFPTELDDEFGEHLRKVGAEFGTTTGRPRRCGWYDAVIARYAARVNGVTDFVLTKLDVLTGLEKVPVCVAYDVDGVRHDEMPVNQTDFHHAVPIYEYFDGWWEDISGARTFEDLPRQRAGLRQGGRGDVRCPDLGRRRRPVAGRDRRRPRPDLSVVPTVKTLVDRHRRPRARAGPRARRSTRRSPRCTRRRATRGWRRSPRCTTSTRCRARRSPTWPSRSASTWSSSAPRRRWSPGSRTPYASGDRGVRPERRGRAAGGLEGVLQGRDGGGRRADRGSRTCTTAAEVEAALDAFGAPYVVKDDALAAGKGVVVTRDRAEALAHAAACERVVIEEFLDGPEVSVFAICDGTTAYAAAAGAGLQADLRRRPRPQHRRHGLLHAADLGASPTWPRWRSSRSSGRPWRRWPRRGTPFVGCLYVGLALTETGPRVIEFNVRFGDPDIQPVLAVLDSPLGELLAAAAAGGGWPRCRRRSSATAPR